MAPTRPAVAALRMLDTSEVRLEIGNEDCFGDMLRDPWLLKLGKRDCDHIKLDLMNSEQALAT